MVPESKMAAAGVYKLDDGTSTPNITSCFPVRGVLAKQAEEAGAWLLAKREEEQRRFKAVLCARPRDLQKIRSELRRTNTLSETPGYGSRFTGSQVEDRVGLLDGFFLMRVHCVDDPSDLCAINISDKELFRAKEVDFQLFDNVAYINAGENTLPFEIFRYFPIVRELELPVNDITNISVNFGDFQQLEVLDLSYNSISEDSILSLGFLPRLKVLDLSYNSISEDSILSLGFLPRLKVLDLSYNSISEDSILSLGFLPRLKVLDLSYNSISENSILSLGFLPRLKVLDLSYNSISENSILSLGFLPRLKVLDLSYNSISEDSILSLGFLPRLKVLHLTGNHLKSLPPEMARPHIEPDDLLEENPVWRFAALEILFLDDNKLTELQTFASLAGLKKLKHLHMDHNQVYSIPHLRAMEGGLLESPSFPPQSRDSRNPAGQSPIKTPQLSKENLHDGTADVGTGRDPPLLKRFLTDRLGINMVRLKPGELQKPPVVVEQKPKRTGPPASAYTLSLPTATDMGSSTPPSSHMTSTGGTVPRPDVGGIERAQTFPSRPLPPISSSQPERPRTEPSGFPEPDSDDSMPGLRRADAWEHLEPQDSGTREGKRQPTDDSEPIFLTQIDDQGEEVKEEQKETAPEERRRRKHKKKKEKIPEKYRGYEILLDADGDVGTNVPTDINGTVRALEYALKHPLVFRDTAVDLSTVQKPFQPAKKTRAMPPAPTRERRIEKLDRMLDQMKDEITVIETSLASALKDKKKFKREFPEAAQLLGEVQAKYNTVRAQSMQEHKRVQEEVRQTVQEIMDTKEKIRQITNAAKDS
uniref:X-ray radiation resistance-associated protein 1 n=1 Tax=Branchiostoma floridae TaxID=7739 RepID=C3ZIZ9_BRAFL|eukprot:XP_002591504.1 hypothetical protein BRAFLDRAFT_105270 [Branchiostoma floridae]